MRNRITWWASALALALGLVAGVQTAAAQSATPGDVVRAWFAAYNAHDLVRLRALFNPAAKCKAEYANPAMPAEFGVDEFIAETAKASPADHVIVNGITWDGGNTVVADVEPVFVETPPLAHPVTGTMTFKVENGRITYWEFRFSEQSRKDVAAAMAAASPSGAAPGMPRTGMSDLWRLGVLVMVCALCLFSGALMRRAGSGLP
jgi:limonene-1,2-epoxide hydrolase